MKYAQPLELCTSMSQPELFPTLNRESPCGVTIFCGYHKLSPAIDIGLHVDVLLRVALCRFLFHLAYSSLEKHRCQMERLCGKMQLKMVLLLPSDTEYPILFQELQLLKETVPGFLWAWSIFLFWHNYTSLMHL
jgi:hypothetical protein